MANDNGIKIEVKPEVAKGEYSNLAIITHSHTEFILDFASMLPGLPKPEVHSRIIMNPEHAKNAILWISALTYLLHLVRKLQILSSSCSIFAGFLYLCALEILPTGVLVTSAVIF